MASGEEFTRSHPIEGRGLRAGLFQCLLRTNAGSTSAEVAIPDTVAFEHGYPRWWYQYDSKSKELRRSAGGKDLHAANIHSFFVSRAPKINGKSIAFVAAYIYAAGDINADGSVDGGSVAVDYHTDESLHRFLLKTNDPRKKHGILQGIELPLEFCYTVISVMWSPQVNIVRRRASRRMLTDARSSATERLVTFDGPEHYSREVNCADETKEKVVGACRRIAEHMSKSAHLKVCSMQNFFIIGRNGDPVLLWCGSLFLVNPHRITAMPAVPPTLMLMPTFVTAPEQGADDIAVDETLLATDAAQRLIELSMAPPGTGHRSPRGGAAGDLSQSLSGAGGSSGDAAVGSPAAAAARHRRLRTDASQFIAERIYASWYSVSEAVATEYARLLDQERTATLLVSDVLYAAHSRFMATTAVTGGITGAGGDDSFGHGAGASIEVPFELSRCLGGQEHVNDLFRHIGLFHEDDGGGNNATHVTVDNPKKRLAEAVALHPVPKLISDAERWLSQLFAEKQRALRVQCLPAVEDAVARAVAMHFVGGVDIEAACAL